jgi:hypothetical protein
MEKHTIGGLKKKLVAATDFYEIQDYFLTLTETNRTVLDGKLGKNKVLKELIASILTEIGIRQDMVKKDEKIILVNLLMIEVRPRFFWHGSGLIHGKHIFTFFYFEELDKGMIAVAKGSQHFFARVSIQNALNEDLNPMESFSDN